MGGSRKLVLNGRSTIIGNFGSQRPLPRELIGRKLADLGLTWDDLEE